jgi:hypothetical protein
MQDAGCLQGSDQVELDVVGREALEQTPALAEQHRHELDLEVLAVGSVAADPDDLGDVAVEEAVTVDRLRIRVTNEHELRPRQAPSRYIDMYKHGRGHRSTPSVGRFVGSDRVLAVSQARERRRPFLERN